VILTFRATAGFSAIFAVTMMLLLASTPRRIRIRNPARQ
jgi:hypothetical protein